MEEGRKPLALLVPRELVLPRKIGVPSLLGVSGPVGCELSFSLFLFRLRRLPGVALLDDVDVEVVSVSVTGVIWFGALSVVFEARTGIEVGAEVMTEVDGATSGTGD